MLDDLINHLIFQDLARNELRRIRNNNIGTIYYGIVICADIDCMKYVLHLFHDINLNHYGHCPQGFC